MNVIAIIVLCCMSYYIGWQQGNNPTFFQRKKPFTPSASSNKKEMAPRGKIIPIEYLREKNYKTKNK